jgi:hypothetical protein
MCDYLDKLTAKYRESPDEMNADADALQDACNLAAVANTFVCMARACNFKYDNPAVLATLDKMNSLCGIQGIPFIPERGDALSKAYNICMDARIKREGIRKSEKEMELDFERKAS